MLIYKVIETSTVTEDILEKILNEWVPQGWQFDSIQFVIRDASKRPAMAFVFFVREDREVSDVSGADHIPGVRGRG